MSDDTSSEITALTVQLLSAFVANNNVPSEALPDLIRSTRAALTDNLTTKADAAAADEAKSHVPAVSVRKSLASDDHIISLIDGKPYKTLKRHLASHGLSPDDYRARYGLPKNYPLVARSYSTARRAVAQKMGLGRKPASAEPPVAAASPDATAAAAGDVPAAGRPAKRKGRTPAAAPRTATPTPPSTTASPEESTGATSAQTNGKGNGGRKPRKRLSIAAPQETGQPATTLDTSAKAAKPKKAAARRSEAKSKEKPAPRTRRKADASASQ